MYTHQGTLANQDINWWQRKTFCPPENNVICKELYEIKITDFTLTNKWKKTAHSLKKCTFSKGTNLSKSRMGSQCPSRRCTLHCKTLSMDQKSCVHFFCLQSLKSCSAVLTRTIIVCSFCENETEIAFEDNVQYCIKEGLCKYFLFTFDPHPSLFCKKHPLTM